MIELNALWVVLMLEAVIALVLLIVIYSLLSNKKNSHSNTAANDLIEKIEGSETVKAKQLEKMISGLCAIDAEKQKDIVAEISHCERTLYQQIIQLFLNRDVTTLEQIDQYVDRVLEPYRKLLQYAAGDGKADDVKATEQKIAQLMQERDRIAEQLTMAMNTMDEISAEYTRVFSGTQSELDLKNSCQKMLEIFHQAGQQARQSIKATEQTTS